MRFKLFVILQLFIASISHSQIIFQKTYPGTIDESMAIDYEFIQTKDNGYLMCNVPVLMKLDSAGTLIWRLKLNYTTNLNIGMFSVIKDYSNGYLVSGSPMITSLDSNCSISWMKQIISNHSISIYSSRKSDATNFILGGVIGINNIPSPCLLKIDSTGTILWCKMYKTIPNIEAVKSLEVTNDGCIIACGTAKSVINPGNSYDCVIFKVDTAGIVQWSKRYISPATITNGETIRKIDDNEFIVSGKRNQQRFLMKIDSSGNVLWEKWYAVGISGIFNDVILTSDNGFGLIGDVTDVTPVGTGQTSTFIKTDSLGNVEWARYLGGFGSVSASQVLRTNDNGYAIAGRRNTFTGSTLNLIKTDSLGHTGGCYETNAVVSVTTVNDSAMNFMLTDSVIVASTIPYTPNFPLVGTEVDICNFQGTVEFENILKEIQIVPNPNSGAFNIIFTDNLNNHCNIEILDKVGRIIYSDQIETGAAGKQINLPTSIAAGIYYCRINFSNGYAIKKLIIYK